MLAVEIAAALVVAYIVLIQVPPIGRRWLVAWHGQGEAQQYQFYRCHGCRRLVTHRLIPIGGCACHESSKISPAKLTLVEKIKLLYLPWTITSPRRLRTARREMAAGRAVVR